MHVRCIVHFRSITSINMWVCSESHRIRYAFTWFLNIFTKSIRKNLRWLAVFCEKSSILKISNVSDWYLRCVCTLWQNSTKSNISAPEPVKNNNFSIVFSTLMLMKRSVQCEAIKKFSVRRTHCTERCWTLCGTV